MPFNKVSTPGNLVKLRHFTQWSIRTKWLNHNDDQNDAKSNDSEQIRLLEYWSVCNYIITKKIKKIWLKKIKITSIIILPKRKSRYRHTSFFSRSFHKRSQHEFLWHDLIILSVSILLFVHKFLCLANFQTAQTFVYSSNQFRSVA